MTAAQSGRHPGNRGAVIRDLEEFEFVAPGSRIALRASGMTETEGKTI